MVDPDLEECLDSLSHLEEIRWVVLEDLRWAGLEVSTWEVEPDSGALQEVATHSEVEEDTIWEVDLVPLLLKETTLEVCQAKEWVEDTETTLLQLLLPQVLKVVLVEVTRCQPRAITRPLHKILLPRHNQSTRNPRSLH